MKTKIIEILDFRYGIFASLPDPGLRWPKVCVPKNHPDGKQGWIRLSPSGTIHRINQMFGEKLSR
jgi:hypothetical protein